MPSLRRWVLAMIGLGVIAAGIATNQPWAGGLGAGILLAAFVLGEIGSMSLLGIQVIGNRQAEARDHPELRSLSKERIAGETELYRAVLRLQSARRTTHVRMVPKDLDDQINTFWRDPKSLGVGSDNEQDVKNLMHRIEELLPTD